MKYIIFSLLYAILIIQTTTNVVCYSTMNDYNICLDHKRNLSWVQ